MKKFAWVFLLFAACSRDTAERASPPVSTTEAASTTAITSTTATTSTTVTTPPPTAPEAPAAPAVNGPKLAFVDEGTRDPSFVAYRDKLLAAVRAHDVNGVVARADPKIRTSFGGGGGAGDLRKLLARPGTFADLEQILTLGGKFQGDSFWAPYVYAAYPDAQDAFTTMAIIADDVPLRDTADANGRVLAHLSRDIVERVGQPAEDAAWTKVKTANDDIGFVESKFVRSPIDYRAGFLKTKDEWRMNALVAGD